VIRIKVVRNHSVVFESSVNVDKPDLLQYPLHAHVRIVSCETKIRASAPSI
jgi:hypothetical protein